MHTGYTARQLYALPSFGEIEASYKMLQLYL